VSPIRRDPPARVSRTVAVAAVALAASLLAPSLAWGAGAPGGARPPPAASAARR
jgi:hypothetical protein